MEIQTDRLLLSSFMPTDAQALFEGLQQYKEVLIRDFPITYSQTGTLEATQQYLKDKAEVWQERKGLWLGIFLSTPQKVLIGSLLLRDLSWRVPKGELAYYLFPPYQKKGYAREALRAFSDWCFEEQGIRRLCMRIATHNTPSYRLAEACGFEKEGCLRKEHRTGEGDLVDVFVYARIMED
ncbi:MAG: GNAT family N-acetyltransferase [Bacteroidota bacterium]